jgi:hypothetical protein
MKSLVFFLIILEISPGRIIIDLEELPEHKSLHNKVFEAFKEKGITPPLSTTTASYESGIIQCFGETTTTEMEQILKSNPQLPSICNISFSEMSLETKIYCYSYSYTLLALWIMLMLSALMYQIRTLLKVTGFFKIKKDGEIEANEQKNDETVTEDKEEEAQH